MSARIYLAGPFFSKEQNERLQKVADQLSENKTVGYVYQPVNHQQDAIVKKYGGLETAMHEPEWQTATYRADTQAIHQADAIVAILDYDFENGNLVPDPGTVYEIGYAQANNKPIILIQSTDVKDDPLNLMLSEFTAYFDHNDIAGNTDVKLSKYDFINFPQLNNANRNIF